MAKLALDPVPVEDLKQQCKELIKACREKQEPVPQTKKRSTSFRTPYQTEAQGKRKSRRKLPTSREEAEKAKKEEEEKEKEAQPLADEAGPSGDPDPLIDDEEEEGEEQLSAAY